MANDFLKANNCIISVKSKENEGSVFTILFPLNEEPLKKRTKEIQYN